MHTAYNLHMAVKNIQIRLDETLKKKAERILHDLGLDMPTALRLFLSKVVHSRSIPFQVTLDNESEDNMGPREIVELLAAYREVKEEKSLFGPFDSADEMLDSLQYQSIQKPRAKKSSQQK